jgi:hypothetical protein
MILLEVEKIQKNLENIQVTINMSGGVGTSKGWGGGGESVWEGECSANTMYTCM